MSLVKLSPKTSIFDVAIRQTGRAENFIDILIATGKENMNVSSGDELLIPDDVKLNTKVTAFYTAKSAATSYLTADTEGQEESPDFDENDFSTHDF